MSIKSGVSSAPTDLAAASNDTTLFAELTSPSRAAITGMSLFNNAVASRIVDIYESPDTTSAAGEKIASYNIDANASVDVVELIGQGVSSGQNIIGRQTTGGASAGDVNCKLTYTLYTAGS